MQLTITLPVKESNIELLSKKFYSGLASKDDFVNISKALHLARSGRYPRTKRQKYGSLQRGFSLEEFKEFLSLMKPEEFRFRFYCIWSVWWGKREGEAFIFNLQDINLETQSVIIFREKNEGPQEFKVDDALWIELMNYIRIYEKEIKVADGFIFFSASRTQKNAAIKHWSSGWIRRKFREICSRNEKFNNIYCNKTDCWHPKATARQLYQFTVHSLRYTFAYIAIDFFKDATVVKELMGHRKLDSTAHYIENYRKSHVKQFSLALQKESALKQLL